MTSGTFSTRVQWYSGHRVAKRKARRAAGRALKHMLCVRVGARRPRNAVIYYTFHVHPKNDLKASAKYTRKMEINGHSPWDIFRSKTFFRRTKCFFAGNSDIQLKNWKSRWVLSGLSSRNWRWWRDFGFANVGRPAYRPTGRLECVCQNKGPGRERLFFITWTPLLLRLITQNRHLPIAPLNNQSINDRHTAALIVGAAFADSPAQRLSLARKVIKFCN